MALEMKPIEQVSGGEAGEDVSCKTFIFHDETHTLANALRWMLMKNPDVEFCGYCIPHPTEQKIQMRIQTKGIPAEQALKKSLEDLHRLFGHVLATFEKKVADFRG